MNIVNTYTHLNLVSRVRFLSIWSCDVPNSCGFYRFGYAFRLAYISLVSLFGYKCYLLLFFFYSILKFLFVMALIPISLVWKYIIYIYNNLVNNYTIYMLLIDWLFNYWIKYTLILNIIIIILIFLTVS